MSSINSSTTHLNDHVHAPTVIRLHLIYRKATINEMVHNMIKWNTFRKISAKYLENLHEILKRGKFILK